MSLQTFLLKEDGGFLLQENIGKIIIDTTPSTSGGGSGGTSKSIGKSLVKKQSEKPTEIITFYVKGKLLLSLIGKVKSKVNSVSSSNGIVFSKLLLQESMMCISKIITTENTHVHGGIIYEERLSSESTLLKHTQEKILDELKSIRIKLESTHKLRQREKKIKRLNILLEQVKNIPVNMELVNRTVIGITLGNNIIKTGDLLRITTNVNRQVPQLWMRILSSKGVIVQKAGLVKRSTTGFQILISTTQLDKGKYIIQVSEVNKFSSLSVADFEVKGKSSILPIIALSTGIISPDTPNNTERLIYRTMMDSKVDEICKKVENKRFRSNDRNKPVIPQHFGCRCFYEVDKKNRF